MSFGWEMNTGNIDDGYAEACVRALSKSFILREKYEEFIGASDLNEFKVLLEDTDYAKYINTMGDGNIEPVELKRRMYEKLRDEMEYIMGQASSPLAEFLEMMMHSYQIENVVSLMSSKRDGRINPVAARASQNPLGEFQGFQAIQKLAAEADVVTLFQEILIDLPVGEYFRKYIDKIIQGAQDDDHGGRLEMAQITEKINTFSSAEQLVNIKKIWLTEFHRWTMKNCNESTREVMDELLKAESDWETLQIIYNSFGKADVQGSSGKSHLKNLFNNLGHLYPGRTSKLTESRDYRELQEGLRGTSYFDHFQKIQDPVAANEEHEIDADNTIDDCQKQDLAKRYSLAYFGQFHYGVFYAYLKLKEIEIKNIFKLATIFQLKALPKTHSAWKKFVPPFEWELDNDA